MKQISRNQLIHSSFQVRARIKLARKGKLDSERKILEHFRFKDTFIRRSKKVFISFVPQDLVERISRSKPIEWNKTKKKVARKVKRLRFADIREFHGSFTTKCLKQSEIDFLHGCTSSCVFMRNYFNPTWIADLKIGTLKAVKEIQKVINNNH